MSIHYSLFTHHNNTMDIQNIMLRYGIIGRDPKLLMALSKAVQVAPTDLSILITGESGVGKDVFSRLIHDGSNRNSSKSRLISVNCGAIPEGTIESELFGHVKGAFTGADKDRKGYFEEANGGTIFLDEVGELPLSMQVKLLRVLENGEILPVGSSTPRKVDVRVVAATNVDLFAAVHNGRFREDLYYRLNQISITIPPLRERPDDIPLLFRKFSSDVAERYKMSPVFLSPDGKEYVMKYPWYGNVRELKNITEQISVVEQSRTITRAILQNYLNYVPEETLPAMYAGQPAGVISDRELLLKALTMGQMINEMRSEINDLRNAVSQLAASLPAADCRLPSADRHPQNLFNIPHTHSSAHLASEPNANSGFDTHDTNFEVSPEEEFQPSEIIDDEPLALEKRERAAIERALQRHSGNRRLAAQDLHISQRTLYRKLNEYGIQ